jgi:hypothetical protein
VSQTTVRELNKDGTYTTYHRRGLRAWSHPEGEPYMIDSTLKPRKQPCPVCEGSKK